MNRLRTGGSARISFFSFQDIITSVTGILILVTLMLSFSLQVDDPASAEERRLEEELGSHQERAVEVEWENLRMQERRLEAERLPDETQTQAQVEALRRERAERAQEKVRSEMALAGARERAEQLAARRKTVENLQKEIAAVGIQIERLKSEAARARTNQQVLHLAPDREARDSRKTPIAIVVSGERAKAQRLDGTDAREIEIGNESALQRLLARYGPAQHVLIFYFRPSGAKWFESFREQARAGGFEVGYDAVEEQKQIVFSGP